MAEASPAVAIEQPAPVINSVTGALDDACCLIERVRALFESNIEDLNQVQEAMSDGHSQDRLFRIWMIFLLAAEKLEEIEIIAGAIAQAAYADLRKNGSE